MKKTLTILAFVLCSFQNFKLTAQTDTVFWFAAPWVTPDSWWRDNLGFHISTYSNTTTVRIKQPASVFDTTIVVPPFTSIDKYFNYMIDSCENKPANTVLRHGFKVSSDLPINVVYDELSRSPTFYNTEPYSCKGKAALGTNFILPFQTTYTTRFFTADLNGDATVTQSYTQFNIVASEDNTTIWITPKCAITGHAAGITYSVFLPGKGMTYTGQNVSQAISTPSNNLSGTTVTSDKPIAITVSDDSMMPGGGGCYDLVGDQIVPVENTGTDYIAVKGQMLAAANESVFFVGTQNSTTVTINDGSSVTTITLNLGTTKSFTLTQPLTYITSTDKVYAWHISGFGCESGAELLSPLTCFGQDQYVFDRKTNQQYYLNILCQNGAQNSFTLNGNPSLIPATAFTVVPGTAGVWYGAKIAFSSTQLPMNTSNFISNSAGNFGISMLNGDLATGVAYHSMSPFPITSSVTAGTSQTICASTNTIQLNGAITNGNGMWSTNGTGTFTSPGNLNTTYTLSVTDISQPQLTFYLTSNGCDMTKDSLILTINPSPFISFLISPSTVCLNSGNVNLTASPFGGVFTGSMVSGNVFVPAAVGVFTINYNYTASNNCSADDTQTITVSPCTEIKNLDLNDLKIYPNPALDHVKLEGFPGSHYFVTVYDVTGKIVIEKFPFNNSYNLGIEKLNSGLYYLKINSGKKEKYVKLSKL